MSNTVKCSAALRAISAICISCSDAFERQAVVCREIVTVPNSTVHIEPSNTEITVLQEFIADTQERGLRCHDTLYQVWSRF
jgi:hypothetical protein